MAQQRKLYKKMYCCAFPGNVSRDDYLSSLDCANTEENTL